MNDWGSAVPLGDCPFAGALEFAADEVLAALPGVTKTRLEHDLEMLVKMTFSLYCTTYLQFPPPGSSAALQAWQEALQPPPWSGMLRAARACQYEELKAAIRSSLHVPSLAPYKEAVLPALRLAAAPVVPPPKPAAKQLKSSGRKPGAKQSTTAP